MVIEGQGILLSRCKITWDRQPCRGENRSIELINRTLRILGENGHIAASDGGIQKNFNYSSQLPRNMEKAIETFWT
jgi:hypothetical protein